MTYVGDCFLLDILIFHLGENYVTADSNYDQVAIVSTLLKYIWLNRGETTCKYAIDIYAFMQQSQINDNLPCILWPIKLE